MIYKKLIILSIIGTLLAVGSIYFLKQNTYAVTASGWKAGAIIDDSLFMDKDSMSVTQIQSFLNSKVGTGSNGIPGQCDTNGTRASELGGGTRAQYGSVNNNPAPFTCLKDFWEVPKTIPGPAIPDNNYGGKPIPSGAKSAAQLIWDAAQKYNISPNVLLVKLGTESAGPLTSDDWPFLKQYTYAMGAHCPDSGAGGSANCDTDYSGFSIQISEAASLLRWYLNSMNQPWWSYKKPYQNNNILWNISESNCGGSDVYIENKATAALYTYTPYQPNQAALNNMYGLGNGCSAYGNRNFWRTYSDWFGPTTGPTWAALIQSQALYSDSDMQVPLTRVGSYYIATPGQIIYGKVQAQNTGRGIWDNNAHLGTTIPLDRASAFVSDSWISPPQRVADLSDNPVISGDTGEFKFILKAPIQADTYIEDFGIVEDGKAWTSVNIKLPFYIAAPASLPSNYSADQLDSKADKNILYSGEYLVSADGFSSLSLTNDGLLILRTDFQQTWSSIARGGVGARLVMQDDGNLVLYTKENRPVWNTETNGKGSSKVNVQVDGNLVVYNGVGATWSSGTSIGTSHVNYAANRMSANSFLYVGQKMQTESRKYTLYLQTDGNLVLYSPKRPLWASNTVGSGANFLVMQTDGNLVIYDNKMHPVWNSGTAGIGDSNFNVQTDGNMVIYSALGKPVWATGTNGQI